jgi:hypothetical protein
MIKTLSLRVGGYFDAIFNERTNEFSQDKRYASVLLRLEVERLVNRGFEPHC